MSWASSRYKPALMAFFLALLSVANIVIAQAVPKTRTPTLPLHHPRELKQHRINKARPMDR